jgi:hypothetical protein
VLSALAPESLARLRFPLGEMRKPRCASWRARRASAVARKRDSQDLCFLAGTGQGAFLERHGGLGERPGRSSTRQGRVLGEHAGAHVFTVGQRHGLGIGGTSPLYVLATDTHANTVTVGPRDGAARARVAVREATLHRDGACVDGVRVRSHGRRLRLPPARRGRRRAPRARERGAGRAGRAHRSRAARVPVRGRRGRRLRHHRLSLAPPRGPSGRRTLRSRAMTSDEIRERYLSFFEERGHKRMPSASLVPSAHDPSALLTVAGCTR